MNVMNDLVFLNFLVYYFSFSTEKGSPDFEEKEHVGNVVGNKLQAARNSLEHLLTERRNAFRTSLLVAFALAYNAYFIAGDQYNSICRMYSKACSPSDHVICAVTVYRSLKKIFAS